LILERPPTPEQILIDKQEQQIIDRALDRLPPRFGLAARWYFGLRCEPMTFRDIAERYDVSTSRAQQIVSHKALGYLRRRLRKAYPDRYEAMRARFYERATVEPYRPPIFAGEHYERPKPPESSDALRDRIYRAAIDAIRARYRDNLSPPPINLRRAQ